MNTRIVLHAICNNCHSEVTELIEGTNLCTACRGEKLGKLQKNMLKFAKMLGYNNWHSLATDYTTQKTAKSLVKRGLIRINEFNQFSLTIDGNNTVLK